MAIVLVLALELICASHLVYESNVTPRFFMQVTISLDLT